jgi:hypothetical protein
MKFRPIAVLTIPQARPFGELNSMQIRMEFRPSMRWPDTQNIVLFAAVSGAKDTLAYKSAKPDSQGYYVFAAPSELTSAPAEG